MLLLSLFPLRKDRHPLREIGFVYDMPILMKSAQVTYIVVVKKLESCSAAKVGRPTPVIWLDCAGWEKCL